MVQAARSGRQNIAEGSRAAATSSQTELRLLNVARASLEELLLDFEDFLRHRRLAQWYPDSPEAMAVRQVPQRYRRDRSGQSDPSDLTDLTDPPGQLPPRSADRRARAGVRRGGRLQRATRGRSVGISGEDGSAPSVGSVRSDRLYPGPSAVREAHGLAHRQERKIRRQAVLGLLRLSRLHGYRRGVSRMVPKDGKRLIHRVSRSPRLRRAPARAALAASALRCTVRS